jgi:hypothetical protein
MEQNETQERTELMELRVMINQLHRFSLSPKSTELIRLRALGVIDNLDESTKEQRPCTHQKN